MSEMIMTKLEEIFANEDLAAKIQASASLEEAYELLRAEGLSVTYEAFAQEFEQIKNEMCAPEEEELDADTLDLVSGGCKHTAERYYSLARSYARRGQVVKAMAYYVRGVAEARRPCRH